MEDWKAILKRKFDEEGSKYSWSRKASALMEHQVAHYQFQERELTEEDLLHFKREIDSILESEAKSEVQ